jgi:hypothetical protein
MKPGAKKVLTTTQRVVRDPTMQRAFQGAQTLSNMTTGNGIVTGARQPDQQMTIFPRTDKSVPDKHVVPGFNNAPTASQAPLGERAPVSGGSNNASETEPTTSSNSQSDNSSPRAADVAQPHERRKRPSHRSGQRQQARSAPDTEMDNLAARREGHVSVSISKSAQIQQEIDQTNAKLNALWSFQFWSASILEAQLDELNRRLNDAREAEQEKQILIQRKAALEAQLNNLKQSDAEKIDSLEAKLTQEGKLERAAVVSDYITSCKNLGVAPSLEGLARYATKTITRLKATVARLEDELSSLKTQVKEMDERYKTDKKKWEDDLQAERDDHEKTKKALEVANGKITQLETDRDAARDDRDKIKIKMEENSSQYTDHIQRLENMILELQQKINTPVVKPATRQTGTDKDQTKVAKQQIAADTHEGRLNHFAKTGQLLIDPSSQTCSPLPSPKGAPLAKAAVPPAAHQHTTTIPDDWETVDMRSARKTAMAAGDIAKPTFSQGK